MAKKDSTDKTVEKEEKLHDSVAKDTESEETVLFVDECAEAKKAAEEYKDMAQRIQAEFDNYRKRNVESVRIAREDGKEDVLAVLLGVIDNFERGLNALDEVSKPGVELIYKQVLSILDKFEVKEIEALGKAFDPQYHHAIAQCEDAERANSVVEVFQKGYIRKNKVLRPSLVKVAQ